MINKLIYMLYCTAVLTSCAIRNDIPYPIEEANIVSFEVEGQRAETEGGNAQATINTKDRSVTLFVNDAVDISNLKITKLVASSTNMEVEIFPDSAACKNYDKFPRTSFESLDDIPLSMDTRMNFSQPVKFLLRTYQDYTWTVTVKQLLERTIVLENQIGDPVIDVNTNKVIVYVAPEQDLNAVAVTTFNLAGEHGSVDPDPTTFATFDFSSPRDFHISYGWDKDTWYKWTVYVYHASDDSQSGSSSVFPMCTSATLTGSIQSGKTPVVEYKKQAATSWSQLPASAVTVKGTSYSASFSNLSPGTAYAYRVSVDGTAGEEQSFITVAATPLENGSFDDWSSEAAVNGTLWQPWSTSSFWDTGNRGATTIADSNSIPTSETCNGSGKAASLETRWVVMKLAAGNIFTGSYVRTDVTNGVLSFGREFSSFPSKLRINYKYTSATIDKIGEDALSYLKGQPDSCHIYIALTDWDQPLEIRTRPSERQLFDKNDSHVIAYAEYISGNSDSQYQQKDLVLDYRYTNRTPKYILVVASASKYGDYFTGGVGSKLLIDNFELIYD
ncbi:PCMD domain-containing protein [Phocaeicola barnesiae]|nr:putative lipoprotein [Bacteroides sp. CAG:714]